VDYPAIFFPQLQRDFISLQIFF